MRPIRTAAPAEMPVSVSRVKSHLRVDFNDDDILIYDLVSAAVAYLDGWSGVLGRCMISQTWQFGMSGWAGCIRLPFPDVASVSIAYQDAADASQTVATAEYEIIQDELGSFVRFKDAFSDPDLYDDMQEPITVTLTAGYGGAGAVPTSIKQAILLLVAHWYENRASVSEMRLEEAPMAFRALIEPHRHKAL